MQQKYSDCVDIFNEFVNQVQQINYQNILNTVQQIYAVREFKIDQLTPTAAIQIYQNIFLKFNRNLIVKSQLNWWENQLRIFVWMLVLYVEIKKTKIQDLNSKDWEFFSSVFPHKKQILFEYQSINILKQHGQAKKWPPQQDQLFSALVNQKGLKCKWSELAKILYIESQKKFFRTPKQCRERWLNHLDPSKSKSQWTIQQDYILIRYVYQKQKRWAQISKLLQNKRNQHSIKNRFKSLTTKEQKYHKEKLQEAQLIACIFKRYTNHLNVINQNRIDELFSSIPTTKNRPNSSPILFEQRKQIEENRQNTYVAFNPYTVPQKMFPFAWVPKKKDQKSFIPFRKSQEFLPADTNGSQFKAYNYGISSLQDLTNPYSQSTYPSSGNFLSKFRSQFKLPTNKQYEHQKCKQQDIQENFYPSVLGQSNNFNQNDITFNKNYQQFLPILDDQFQDSLSIQQEFYEQDHVGKQQQQDTSKQNQMDEEERRIRAEIFLAEDPFQLLKPYFIKNSVSTNQRVERK